MATPCRTSFTRFATRASAIVVATVVLAGCFTGQRPTLADNPTLEMTGRSEIDAVLQRLDATPYTDFTADYEILTRLGGIDSVATVVQSPAGRRSITINEVRFLIDGATEATCDLATGQCDAQLNDQRTYGELFVGHEFYASTPATRLRNDAKIRIGDPVASEVTIAGQSAVCVDVPVTGGTKQYCALDSGPLARYDGNDLHVELTDYSPTPDESAFATD